MRQSNVLRKRLLQIDRRWLPGDTRLRGHVIGTEAVAVLLVLRVVVAEVASRHLHQFSSNLVLGAVVVGEVAIGGS
jgi:hypothetical protein